ncbi:MAG: bacillithiol biosynthesis cysteine-adding enzyme BshC [Chitinophagaceae bacterium]|nr:MAG: bacillithiol biosynthesis cysteine-adding enzyme BshC [Chitinophagaceae bacterium]
MANGRAPGFDLLLPMFFAETLANEATHSFSRIVVDYLADAQALRPFYQHRPDLAGISEAIAERRSAPQHRTVLVEALQRQYRAVDAHEAVRRNIEALAHPDTFTVTTAHQPNLLGGPLYFIYKILHAIRLAEELEQAFAGMRFVPVFYMGSEDADLEELNHFTVRGKRYTWHTKQTGAVGRMIIDNQLIALVDELEGQLAVEAHGSELIALVRSCYIVGRSIQDATFALVDALFGRYGLVVLNADDAALKQLMQPVFEADLFRREASAIVSDSSARLQEHYDVQAHPREINLFYLEGAVRARIEQRGSEYFVLGTDIRFSENELRTELADHPERFSPNVILRGLYQETILPNVAFIGGGGELAYWLQLKDLFTHYKVPFPVLVLRNSLLLVHPRLSALAQSLSVDTQALFFDTMTLMNKHLERLGKQPKLNGEVAELQQLYAKLKTGAAEVDVTLGQHVDALQARALQLLAALEKKMQRAARRKEDATQRQLQKLKDQLFPKGGLQERVENFTSWYAESGPAFIDALLAHSGSLEQQFTVLYQNHSANAPGA